MCSSLSSVSTQVRPMILKTQKSLQTQSVCSLAWQGPDSLKISEAEQAGHQEQKTAAVLPQKCTLYSSSQSEHFSPDLIFPLTTVPTVPGK